MGISRIGAAAGAWRRIGQRGRATALIALVPAAMCPSGQGGLDPSGSADPLLWPEVEGAVHLLSRATYGVRPRDVEEVLRSGPEAWLDRQLRPESVEASLPVASGVVSELTFVAEPSMVGPSGDTTALPRPPRRLVLRDPTRKILSTLLANKLLRATASERQLEQVMVDFWFNHFSVFRDKVPVPRALEDYEEAIRQNVFGRFEELLVATAGHPAMLIYLDNYLSGAPPPESWGIVHPGDPPTPARGPINENYARELLELHTLGVDGGYTQQDVVEVARAFTGWSVPLTVQNRAGQASYAVPDVTLRFEFRGSWHDPGEKVVLGHTLPAGRGFEDGIEVLEILARHPSTARHVATRLVRHFVADEPPPELVGDLAGVFLSSGGDLRAVTRALFTAEAFYDPAYRRGKVKRPFEFLVSALRVVDAELGPMAALTLEDVLRSLQHLPYAAPAPTGYPVTADAWLSHGAMIDRMTFAFDLSQGALQWSPPTATAGALILRAELPAEPAVTFDPWRMLDGGVTRAVLPGRGTADPADGRLEVGEARLPPAALRALVRQVLERTIYGVSTSELEATILEELASRPADPEVLLRRAIALAVGSPEFQRH